MLLFVVLVLVVFLCFLRYRQQYWKRRNVHQIEPKFLLGNATRELMGKRSIFLMFREIYEQAKVLKQKHMGIYFFLRPVYVPTDITIIKQIMVRDFSHFMGHGGFAHPSDRLSMNLFNMEGEPWKLLRTTLTPTFTSGKMKMMFETLLVKSKGLEKLVDEYASRQKPLDIKDITSRFGTDVIASCAFGIENDALGEDKNNFRYYGKRAITPHSLRLLLSNTVSSSILGQLGFKSNDQDVDEFFSSTIIDTINYRKQFNVFRKDFIDLLLQLKHGGEKSTTETRGLTEDEFIAQCFVFFVGGFETSSTTMTFALLELSLHEDIQEILRAEILEVLDRHDGMVTYTSLMDMKYLDMVINETLRKYPPLASIPRVCTKTYQIPGTDTVIEKGTKVQIPIWGIHMDSEYYPNPEDFNPENFTKENKANRPEMTFLPFGEGPRMCIGLRFGILQTKLGLVSLLKRFKFTLNNKTQIPIQMKKISVVLAVEGDVWLNVSKL